MTKLRTRPVQPCLPLATIYGASSTSLLITTVAWRLGSHAFRLRAIAHAIRMGYCFIHNLSTHNTLYPCLLPCYTRLIWQWLKRMELVMDLDADDLREIIQQNRKLLQTHKRHKRVIEGQIAGFGKLHAPSHLLLQESDLDEQIQECESNIEAV